MLTNRTEWILSNTGLESPPLCCVGLIEKVVGGHQQGDGLVRSAEREIAPIQTNPDLPPSLLVA